MLLISYHFPPFAGSSGVLRPLTMTKYLPDFGWTASVLTIDPSVYPATNRSQMSEIPEGIDVVRARAFDLKQKLSVMGRYPSLLAFPDRWNSWLIDGVNSGLEMIRRHQPDVIFSTFPIATAHWIALRLQRKTGLPWVADFRDSMTEENYPKERLRRLALRRLEKKVVNGAVRVLFTAPGCRQMYAQRYPACSPDKWKVIENGFDEATFSGPVSTIDDSQSKPKPTGEGRRRPKLLLHSGILYPEERDPSAFFAALAQLKGDIVDLSSKLTVRLRATGHDEHIAQLVAEYAVADIVELAPAIAYSDAVQEMTRADGLLIFQAANCNHQIPAKIYEYLRTGVPIIALTDPAGDTAGVLTSRGFSDSVVRIDNSSDIKARLARFIEEENYANGTQRYEPASDSRYERARQLGLILDELC